MPLNTKNKTAQLITVILIAIFAIFFVYPLILAVKASVVENGKFTLYWIGRALSNEIILGQLANSFLLAICTTFIALLISIPLATLSNNYEFKTKPLLNALLLVPLFLPPFVGGLAIKRILGQFGTFNLLLDSVGIIDIKSTLPPDWLGSGFFVVAILQALHLFPITYLNTCAAIANLDPAYVQAARNLGASPIRSFFKITLPLLRPGIFAGASIVFIWSFTDIGTPVIVGYDNLAAVTIFREIAQADISPLTYSLVLLLLLAAVSIYLFTKISTRNSSGIIASKAGIASETKRVGIIGTTLITACFSLIIILAILPHIGVILTAISDKWVKTILPEEYTLRHLTFIFTRSESRNALLNSLKYASVATFVDILIGSAIAWLVVRTKALGAGLLDVLSMMPLAVPGLILAAGYIVMTAPGSIFESIGPMNNPFLILVIAYSIRRMPFFVRGVSAGLEQLPVSMEEAARNLGSGKIKTVWKITIPLLAANIIASGVLTFSFAMLEVSDSLVLAQLREDYPLSKEIYVQAMSGNTDALSIASALGVFGMAFLGGSMGIAAILLGKKLGAIFRV